MTTGLLLASSMMLGFYRVIETREPLFIAFVLVATHPIARLVDEVLAPSRDLNADEGLLNYCKKVVDSNFHPVGSCRMGSDDDPSAVLTPDLRVRGIHGLCVFDASMMPSIISANTNAPVMAIADRGVALMMGKENYHKAAS